MGSKFYKDLLERVLWTFVQAAGAEWLITQSLNDTTFKIAGIAGLVSVVKCLIGTQIGASNSGSWLPAREDPPAGDHGAGETELLVRVLVLVIVVVLVIYVIKALVGAA